MWTHLLQTLYSVQLFLIKNDEKCFVFFLQWRPQAIMFEIITDKKFDMVIMLFIGFNMLTMTMDHYKQSAEYSQVLDVLNMMFICIFTTECLMKMFALRYHYFVEPWNLFDLVVVTLSILSEYFWIELCPNSGILIEIVFFI